MAFIRKRPDIGSIFERWSWDALFDDISGLELERCHSATRKPNHVIWLACAFDLDDVVDMCCHQEGFNLEMMTRVSLTPLLEASRLGSCRTLSRLIEKGADVWARTPRYKKGALDFGVDNNHPDVVKKLADYGLTQSSSLATTEDSTPSSAVCFLAQDDIYIKREVSTRSVDFLTYEWKGDELMASWRHAASTSCEFENRERLANASWRTWSKVYHKTEEVPPSSVNWYYDHSLYALFFWLTTIGSKIMT
jgi:ankyrin repeat protein